MSESEPHSGQPASEQSGLGLKWVLAGMAVVSISMGIAGYWRYASSEDYVARGLESLAEQGAGLDTEGCIDAALEWHHDCDQNGANAAVCHQAVGMTMFHCLSAADRSTDCEPYEVPETSARWVYAKCEDRGLRCVNKRECACADAYRAVDSFCRTGGEAVQL